MCFIVPEWFEKGNDLELNNSLSIDERKRRVKEGASMVLDDINSVLAQDDRIKYKKEYRYYTEMTYNSIGYARIDELEHFDLTIYKDTNMKTIYSKERIFVSSDMNILANEIYPSIMPTTDYYPFIQYDIDSTIEIKNNDGKVIYAFEIEIEYWTYGCLHFANNTMLLGLDFNIFYFRQVGKDVYFINVPFAT
ncbi:hypothetical protein [Helicobacter saguini]|uniref:Uncharacterized protein n=1 Tax=Helicobacter saguini TaxID=1548018 RepID=A0A6L7D9G7_9HELI|nr:hypothetical protein [Helicobacter saguini]MWV68459.1 hypothetical protein [Helicobacter saguini]MWV71986.1 hypothetical protein [Helicobacter saguini]